MTNPNTFIRNQFIDFIIATPRYGNQDEVMHVPFLKMWFGINIDCGHDAMGVMLMGGEI
jgi:hypothetical protein